MDLYWYSFRKPSPNFRQVFSAIPVIDGLACTDSQIVFHIQENLQLKQQIPLKINLCGCGVSQVPEVADNIWGLIRWNLKKKQDNNLCCLRKKKWAVVVPFNCWLLFHRLKSSTIGHLVIDLIFVSLYSKWYESKVLLSLSHIIHIMNQFWTPFYKLLEFLVDNTYRWSHSWNNQMYG